jgi:hypothetical protein
MFGFTAAAGDTGVIKGVVKDAKGETLPGVAVKVMSGEMMSTGAVTDMDGKYVIKNINPGQYDVRFSYTGYREGLRTGINISPDKTVYLDVTLLDDVINLGGVDIVAYEDPIIPPGFYPIPTLTMDELENLPVTPGDVKGMLMAVTSDMRVNEDGDIYMRGSRTGSTSFLIDGNRCIGSTDVAGTSISGLAVLTGGVPAEYGDCTGGVVVITTKDYMTGIRQKRLRKYAYDEQKKQEEAEKEEKKNSGQQ